MVEDTVRELPAELLVMVVLVVVVRTGQVLDLLEDLD